MARRWGSVAAGMPLAGSALADERRASSVGVLTPGWHPSTVVLAGRGYSPVLLGALGFGAARNATERREQQQLNEVMAQQGFDAREMLATATIDALRTRGVESVSIAVARQDVGRGNSLRRDELPSDVPVGLLLDLHIRFAFLAQTDDEKHWRPGLVVRYLWITPDGRPVGLQVRDLRRQSAPVCRPHRAGSRVRVRDDR